MKYSKSNLTPAITGTRIKPDKRRAQLLTFYIAMVVGDLTITSDAPPCYLTVSHTEIAAASGMSVASIFNYFNNVEDLQTAIEEWALNHLTDEHIETKLAARHIANQWAAVRPISAQQLGIKSALKKVA